MFNKINFGSTAGEQERAYFPELIKDGFYNYNDAVEKIIRGDKFLIQGYKGSGKSTISEKINLQSELEDIDSVNAVNIYLKDYPFAKFSQIYPGDESDETKFPRVWSYLLLSLLVNLMDSKKGNEVWSENIVDFSQSVSKLRDIGLLGSGDIDNITLSASKKSFKISLPKILEFNYSAGANSEATILFHNVVDVLKDMVHKKVSSKTNIVLIDGLDDVYLNKEMHLKILSALIFEANNLNREFKIKGVKAKICILIRVDLYERLPSGNKNKAANDSSIVLNWYNDVKDASQTHLVKAANLRARIATANRYELKDFFHAEINNRETLSFLLSHTRHTPRDFFQLLKYIQEYHDDTQVKVSEDAIYKGLRAYSNDYFLPEIKDETSGYIGDVDVVSFLRAISVIKQREFKFSTLLQHYDTNGNDIDKLKQLLEVLFKCSAIGHKFGEDKYEYVYWNKYAYFDIDKTICLHRGMWKALNLV
ncbi:P-loop ATPase, Sll1717 family [Citrobacter werkmanii]|uniref:P-loop ATPase, Sll1717 family n=1 Tax=Citrobacter werkmanii TaxID=67827 RepID=UPI00123A52A2|nr:hypothetical protein [Citrobacter werkmanii]QET67598.1 hypothetical protein FOB24_19330 [Citrobacter werkmanii]